MQGLRTVRARVSEEDPCRFEDEAEPQGARARRVYAARGVRWVRELRDDVPGLCDYGRKVATDCCRRQSTAHEKRLYERESSDEGQRGDRRGGDSLRLQALFRISHHAAD